MDALRQAIKSTRSMHDLAEVCFEFFLKNLSWRAMADTHTAWLCLRDTP